MNPMKPSNAEWLGEIPEEWSVARIGDFYKLRNEKVSDEDYAPLSVTMKGIVPQLATSAKSDDHNNRKLVKKGDFVINSRSDRRGSCGISPYDGSVSLINTILTPRGEMNPDYYNWLFHTEQFADEFYKWGHGIVNDLWTTRWQEMKSIMIVSPSMDEQQAIANYLDDRCSKIDAIIAEAKASIEEYKELKQAVIYEAVTKGLDKNVEMKDSGNIWYGLIPKHWELHKVCWDYSVELGKMLDQKRISGKNLRPYLRNADIKWDNINFKDLPEMDFGEDELDRYNVQPGDLMICEGGEIGKCNIVPQDCPKGIYYQKALHRVRAYKSSVSKYLRYLIMFLSKSGYINDSAQKATIFHLPAEKLKALRIPAPSVKEQTDIVTYLDVRTGDIDNLISEKQSLIEDLEAYKKSLIYEVVTGKRKVAA